MIIDTGLLIVCMVLRDSVKIVLFSVPHYSETVALMFTDPSGPTPEVKFLHVESIPKLTFPCHRVIVSFAASTWLSQGLRAASLHVAIPRRRAIRTGRAGQDDDDQTGSIEQAPGHVLGAKRSRTTPRSSPER